MSHIKIEYLLMIIASSLIIISFVFNIIAKKTNIPSVLLLLICGMLSQLFFKDITDNEYVRNALILIGKVGLILIVLEAALDLKIEKSKIKMIVKAFLSAVIILLVSTTMLTYFIQYITSDSFINSFVYAIPLSIMSSAIIIPSVTQLSEHKREFMIYESSFADIIGILLFQFFITDSDLPLGQIITNVTINILFSIIISFILAFFLAWLIQRINTSVKLFLIISILVLLYSIGSVFHLASLVIILFFGIILNNYSLFFTSGLKKYINKSKMDNVFSNFHLITLESAFVIRTYFFFIFGLTISIASLFNIKVAINSIAIIIIMFLLRLIFLKLILRRNITPEVYLNPRGLVTILLYYTIPEKFKIEIFDQGIILYTILISSIIMTIALISYKNDNLKKIVNFDGEKSDNVENPSFIDEHE